jgi:hypothetical protein
VTFADGSEAREWWNGRDESIGFDYESRAPATAAVVDPHRVVRLDRNPANNRRTLSVSRRGALAWAARWAIWLQDQLLESAFFF